MRFDVQCVRECLVRERRVFTVRSYLLEGWHFRLVQVPGVGKCWRELVGEIRSKDDLAEYLPFSGFTSVDDWWRKIVGFCGGRRKWLYKVTVYTAGKEVFHVSGS